MKGNAALKIIQVYTVLNNIQVSKNKTTCISGGKFKNLKRPPIFEIYNQNFKDVKCLTYVGE